MVEISASDYALCVQYLLYEKIIEDDYSRIQLFIKRVKDECLHYDGTDFVEYVFRQFLVYKTATETYKHIGLNHFIRKADDVNRIIIFRESKDRDINFLAKLLYYNNGGKTRDYLEWQIIKLSQSINFDIVEEYKSWCRYYEFDESIPDIMTMNFDDIDFRGGKHG